MSVTGYNIDSWSWDGVGDEINKDDPHRSVKGVGQGITSLRKSSDDTDGNTTDLKGVDVLYRLKTFCCGRHRRFGHMLERTQLESQTSDSKSPIEAAVMLIAEKLQELQEHIHGDLFNVEGTDTVAESVDSAAAPPEAINSPDSQAVSFIDKAVTDITGMLQHIEEISPGFIDSLKGDPGITAADNPVSDMAALLELLEELYEQIELAIDRIAADASAGQSHGVEQLQVLNDGVAVAIVGLKERITSQINQIEAIAPGFLMEVRPFVEGDLVDSKESDLNQTLYDALEELSELLEDMVALMNNNFAGDNLPVKDILQENAEEAFPPPEGQHDGAAEVQGGAVTTQEDNITSAALNDLVLELEAVEVFMVIYEQLSDEARSEVAQILVGLAFNDEGMG